MAADMPAETMQGTLYVVATPIGNLDDLSTRAVNVLKSVQIVAAEDTRRTAVLLAHIEHRAPELLSLHEHNEQQQATRLIERLQQGADVALVSDAGTPLVNDPGYTLVGAAAAANVKTVPVPGPSCITAALSVCPLPCQPFGYVGYPAARKSARVKQWQSWLGQGQAVVFLEAPHRIRDTLADLAQLTDRRIMLGRELTKKFEEILVGTADELSHLVREPRGEFVGIVETGTMSDATQVDEQQVLRALLAELSPAQAARIAASICGKRKSEMYALAMALS